jgi:hypothetical protein
VEFLRAARRLLDKIAIFDRHPDLMSESEQQSKLGSGKPARVWGAQEQHTKRLFLGLQADSYDSAQTLTGGQLPETPKRFLALQSNPGRVAPQVAENYQAA